MIAEKITLIGLALDLIIGISFSIRLSFKYFQDSSNLFLRNFLGFFWSFNTFLVLTLFYIPGFIVQNPEIAGTVFIISFFELYLTSAYAARIAQVVRFPKMSAFWTFGPIISLGALVSFFLYINNPVFVLEGETFTTKINPAAMALISLPIAFSFLAAAYILIREGIKSENEKMRYLLLGSAFLLWVIGGPMHVLRGNLYVSIFADIITSLGFIAAFVALIKQPVDNS